MIYFYIGNYGERINLDLFGSIQEIQHKMLARVGLNKRPTDLKSENIKII